MEASEPSEPPCEPVLPPELLAAVAWRLAARGWRRTLLDLCCCSRVSYGSGLPALLFAVDLGGAPDASVLDFSRDALRADKFRHVRHLAIWRPPGADAEWARPRADVLRRCLPGLLSLRLHFAAGEDAIAWQLARHAGAPRLERVSILADAAAAALMAAAAPAHPNSPAAGSYVSRLADLPPSVARLDFSVAVRRAPERVPLRALAHLSHLRDVYLWCRLPARELPPALVPKLRHLCWPVDRLSYLAELPSLALESVRIYSWVPDPRMWSVAWTSMEVSEWLRFRRAQPGLRRVELDGPDTDVPPLWDPPRGLGEMVLHRPRPALGREVMRYVPEIAERVGRIVVRAERAAWEGAAEEMASWRSVGNVVWCDVGPEEGERVGFGEDGWP